MQIKQLPVSCNKDCGGGCLLRAHVESGRLIRITDSPFKRPFMQGVVSAHQGVWPEFNTGGIETAGSVNVLTSTEPTKPSNGSRTHSVLVEVTPEE